MKAACLLWMGLLLMAESANAAFTGPNNAPTANPGGPYSIFVGESLLLDGSASTDINVPQGDFISAYQWDFLADGSFEVFGVVPELSYPALQGFGLSIGVYALRLRVIDSLGGISQVSTSLSITEVPSPASGLLFGSSVIVMLSKVGKRSFRRR